VINLRSATSLTLVAVMLAMTLFMLPQVSNSSAAFAQDRGQSTQNRRTMEHKVLRGTAVKAYVQQLRLKDKALNRALKDMERWGKLPNWESSAVIREVPASKKETASLQFQLCLVYAGSVLERWQRQRDDRSSRPTEPSPIGTAPSTLTRPAPASLPPIMAS
jgi:hypothetical protein